MPRAPLAALLLIPGAVLAQMDELVPLEDDEPQAAETGAAPPKDSAPVILEEFTVDERNVVLSAARTRTTIQEAPGIVTVITAEEIRQRGFRTVNDVLRTVPGFEGGRQDSNGWFEEGTARGQPRTLLILVNGVNVTEPVRNSLTLDRKIPIDAVKRIEVTSGPGGVLWGSNALLGIVNIILKDAGDLDGVEIAAGGGHGRGAQEAVKGRVAYGGVFLGGDVKLHTALDFYSDRGALLEADAKKVLGVLPEPAPDGPTLYQDEAGETDFNSRDWWAASTLHLQLWDQVTLDWLLTWEQDHRQLATGGALLTEGHETVGNDSIQTVGLNWRDRFLDDRFGVSAKVYGVNFQVHEDPFWAFPPAELGTLPLDEGVVISLNIAQLMRIGANLDMDLDLGRSHHLVFGGEAFLERLRGAERGDVLRSNARLAGGDVYGPANCPPPGTYGVPDSGGLTADFADGCAFTETLIEDTDRLVGALYVTDEWKPVRSVAVQPGFRFQASDAYDPVPIFSGALVWNLVAKLFLKLNYAEGFRPPEFQSTSINEHSLSSVSFESGKDIRVEQSRATEAELNAVILEDTGWLKRIYLRGDYGYTVLRDIIRNSGGQFVNSGERGIHSVEFLARADFSGDHELWFGGHFNAAEDSEFGPVRNFPNWVFNGGGRLSLADGHLQLISLATWVGPQEDLNRPADIGEPFPSSLPGTVTTDPSELEVEYVDAYLLLRFGIRAPRLWDDRIELSAWYYNALDVSYQDPDFFFDDRVQSRPQPRGGWSAFGQARVTF